MSYFALFSHNRAYRPSKSLKGISLCLRYGQL